MQGVVAGTLPFAIGAAVSPAILALVVLLLASGQHALRRTWLMALGGTVFTAVFVLICRTILVQVSSSSGPRPADRIIEGLLAVALALLAIRAITAKPRSSSEHPSHVKAALAKDRWWMYVVLGVVGMSLNLSTLLIVLAGSHHITVSGGDESAKVLAALLLLLGACLPLLLPPLLVSLGGRHSTHFLERLNAYMTTHQKAINAGILLVLAALLGWKAITG